MPPRSKEKLSSTTPMMPTTAPITARAYPKVRPGRRPARLIRRASGQLASAAPSAPIPTGRPDHMFVPVMLAAMMLPTAITIECPVLPQTWATNSVAINRPRLHRRPFPAVSGVAVSASGSRNTLEAPLPGHPVEGRQPLDDRHDHARVLVAQTGGERRLLVALGHVGEADRHVKLLGDRVERVEVFVHQLDLEARLELARDQRGRNALERLAAPAAR